MKHKNCPNCDGDNFKWHIGKTNNSDVQDGRLRMHDISVIAFLACEECSETLNIIREHSIEEMLNNPNLQ